MSDRDDLREALDELRREREKAAAALADYIRVRGDDPVAYAMADRILVTERQERLMRLALRNEAID